MIRTLLLKKENLEEFTWKGRDGQYLQEQYKQDGLLLQSEIIL